MTTKFLIGVELDKRKLDEVGLGLEDYFELTARAGARIVKVETLLDARLVPEALQKRIGRPPLALPAPARINGRALKGAAGVIQKLLANGPVHRDVIVKTLMRQKFSAFSFRNALYTQKIIRRTADGLFELVPMAPSAPTKKPSLVDGVVEAIQLAGGLPIGKTKIGEHLASLKFSPTSAGTALRFAMKAKLLNRIGRGNKTVYTLRQQQEEI